MHVSFVLHLNPGGLPLHGEIKGIFLLQPFLSQTLLPQDDYLHIVRIPMEDFENSHNNGTSIVRHLYDKSALLYSSYNGVSSYNYYTQEQARILSYSEIKLSAR